MRRARAVETVNKVVVHGVSLLWEHQKTQNAQTTEIEVGVMGKRFGATERRGECSGAEKKMLSGADVLRAEGKNLEEGRR